MPKKTGKVSRQTLWQRKHRAMGLCVVCSEPAYKGWRCVKHYEQHKITMRLRYIPKVRGRYDVGGSAEFLAAAGREAERKKKRRSGQGGKASAPAEATPKQPAASSVPAGPAPALRVRSATAGRGGGSGSQA